MPFIEVVHLGLVKKESARALVSVEACCLILACWRAGRGLVLRAGGWGWDGE